MSNREIGELLGLTEQTVKNYMTAALRKPGLPNRQHVVWMALREGWAHAEGSGSVEATAASAG